MPHSATMAILSQSTLTSPPEVQRQRTSFVAVKYYLCTYGLQYAMLFPAKLQIIHNGKARFYTNPKDTMAWLDDHLIVMGHCCIESENGLCASYP